eukprot:gene5135-3663_t
MGPFRMHMSLYLSDDPKKSLYGLGFVSDHDLFHNMANDTDMRRFIKDHKIDHPKPGQFVLALGMKRRNLFEWFRRLCRYVVFQMQLPLTPDSPRKKKSESAYKKPRITKADVKDAADKQFEESKKRKLGDEEDEEHEEDDEPEFVDKCTEKTPKKKSSSDKSVSSTTSTKKTDSSGISINKNDITPLKIDNNIAKAIKKIFNETIEADDPEIKTYVIEVSNFQMRAILTNIKLINNCDVEIPTWKLKPKPKDDEDEDDEEDLGQDKYEEEEGEEEEGEEEEGEYEEEEEEPVKKPVKKIKKVFDEMDEDED